MSKLLSYYQLCPVTDEIIGVSQDCDENSIIITLGKKIVYIMQLNHQKQLKSWNTTEHEFSSRVVYDFIANRYVGVLSKIYLKFWDENTMDINSIKKIKMHKSIHEIMNVTVNGQKRVLVIYQDGTCESLESALESKSQGKLKNEKVEKSISKVQFTEGILSYLKQDKIFNFCSVDDTNLKSSTFNTITLDRPGSKVKLMDFSVVRCKTQVSKLVTVWSDKRVFETSLNLNDSDYTIGSLHSVLTIDTSHSLGILAVDENCIAIYSSKDDGACLVLYNLKYKTIQSQVLFKVFFFNFKLWSIDKNIFLMMGEQLSMVPFQIGEDKLSDMIGSQVNNGIPSTVETEMLDEDPNCDSLEFDEDQSDVEGMEMETEDVRQKTRYIPGKMISSVEEASESFNELRSKEIYVEVLRDDEQPAETAAVKCFSNVDESFPLLSENFEVICVEFEKMGCSEIEITNKIVPVLIAANRTEDLGLLMKRYNHVSEEMLVKILKYLLTCPVEEVEEKNEITPTNGDCEFNSKMLCKDKKFVSSNILLTTKQSEHRDVLSIALCSSFNSKTILRYLRREMNLDEAMKLIDCLYKIINSDIFDEYDFRGNLVDGEDFDVEDKLFEWFTILLDSHYQQLLLSKDQKILQTLESWLELVENHSKILNEMISLRPSLERLSKKKVTTRLVNINRWYKITKLPLY